MQRFVRPEPIDGSTRVQRVFDTQHVAHRACRTVSPGQGAFDEIRDRLRRMAKVTHPHLAKIVAIGEEEGELKVVTEWLPGGSIAEHPDPGRLLVGVADALYALHREGLAHGHVHPRSLVFDGEGVLKLVDGGVCDGSVIEDLESFGAALKGLYAGRPMPAALATVAVQASTGAFGDAHELQLALEEAIAMAPPPNDRSIEPDVHVVDTAPPVRVREVAENEEEPETRWLLLLLLAGLLAVLLVLVAAVVGWFAGTGTPVEEPAPVEVRAPPAPAAPLLAPAPAPARITDRVAPASAPTT
ncbi:MAG: protein kinase family protein, partial [Myxococcales bacterium]|nr:protein kinase family protein [Myxococcales bacterium]